MRKWQSLVYIIPLLAFLTKILFSPHPHLADGLILAVLGALVILDQKRLRDAQLEEVAKNFKEVSSKLESFEQRLSGLTHSNNSIKTAMAMKPLIHNKG